MVGVLWHFHLFSHRRTSVPFTDCMPVSSPDPPILIGRLHCRWTLLLDTCLGRLATRSGRLSGVERLISLSPCPHENRHRLPEPRSFSRLSAHSVSHTTVHRGASTSSRPGLNGTLAQICLLTTKCSRRLRLQSTVAQAKDTMSPQPLSLE